LERGEKKGLLKYGSRTPGGGERKIALREKNDRSRVRKEALTIGGRKFTPRYQASFRKTKRKKEPVLAAKGGETFFGLNPYRGKGRGGKKKERKKGPITVVQALGDRGDDTSYPEGEGESSIQRGSRSGQEDRAPSEKKKNTPIASRGKRKTRRAARGPKEKKRIFPDGRGESGLTGVARSIPRRGGRTFLKGRKKEKAQKSPPSGQEIGKKASLRYQGTPIKKGGDGRILEPEEKKKKEKRDRRIWKSPPQR